MAYRLFSLPRLQQLLEMVNLIHLCGMGFFMRSVQQGLDSVHVEYTFGKEVV